MSKRSSLSLDLNANEDQLSDNSRSDSLEEGEMCVCVSHSMAVLMHFVYISIDFL